LRMMFGASVAIAAIFVLTIPGRAQEPVPIASATFVEAPPVIDGIVDDEVWELAVPITGFVQTEPVEGRAASEETVVRILYNDRALFISVICYDSEPDQIRVTDSRRDSGMSDTDSFQVIFDTYHDRQNGFVFGTNPAGIEFDGQVSNEGEGTRAIQGRAAVTSGSGFNLNWDTSWTVRTEVTELGWTAEFEIPLRSLRYGDKPQTWGLNFQRNIRRKNEEVFWAPIERIYNLYRLSSAGELRGLELDTPRNFNVTPYVVGTALRNFANTAETEADFDGDIGFDAKFGVTPSLNLDVTYNTDFAQVEVDEQVVNLTRFGVRFPEKRAFFLENAGLFAAGKSGIDLFFSRRIGIDPSGAAVPIIGGARLSGKVGQFNVGFFNMETDDVPGVTAKNNFTVARVSRELPNRSSLGGIFVSRAATGSIRGNWNRTWGLDGKLGIGQYTDINGFIARTETPGRTGPESAYNIRAQYEQRGGYLRSEYAQVGDDFNPEVGFLTRRNYRFFDISGGMNIRFPNLPWLREIRPHANVRTHWDFDGFMETQNIHLDPSFDFENGWFLGPIVNINTEGLRESFEIAPGVVIPPGHYRHPQLDFRFRTDRSRGVSLDWSSVLGGFYTGSERTFAVSVNARAGATINTSLTWRRSDINLPEGDFVTNLLQTRLNYSLSPRINFQSLIQYNDRSDTWSGNFRFGWLSTAGTGLYVVYNEIQGLHGLGPINRNLIVKYSRRIEVLR
jgi:hypothetical protein